ncbi:MAG: LemA family protein [Gammaproteobacteria bacterium]
MIWIVLLLIVLVIVIGVSLYNRLVTARNAFRNAFAQIDVQLTRRHDLIPNLVEVARRYLQHERQTLEAVIAARTSAVDGLKKVMTSGLDPAAIEQLSASENTLSGALGRLLAVAEAYPDLKADRTMARLSEELTTTENKVAFARQAFNDQVMSYNNAREKFPGNLVAGFFRFTPAQLLQIESVTKRDVPQVTFS